MFKHIDKIFRRKKTTPVMHSRWRLVYDDSAGWVDMCPDCEEFGNGETFCPNCGAQMIEMEF